MSSRRPLHALLAANALSLSGTAMTLLAVPWFVLVTTGSAGRTGFVAACETVPLAVASGLGGPLIDRLGARRAAVLSDLLSAAGISLVPLLHATVGLAFWQLCVLVALVGLVRAPGATARAVLLPPLIEQARLPVERATSAYDGVSRGAQMVGAPLAGALIALLGPANVLLVDAVTFVLSAVLLGAAVRTSPLPSPPEGEGYLHRLSEGIRALRADPLILRVMVMVMVTNLLDAAWASVLMPVYARDVLHSSVALGVLFGVFGLGALLGAVLYGAVGPRLPRWPVLTAAFLIAGAPRYGLMAVEPPYPLLVGAQLLFGLAVGCLNPILSAVEYERIPRALQSRILGVATAGVLVGLPVGALVGGLAVEQVGLRPVLVGTAVLYLAATLSPLRSRHIWRQLDATRGSLLGDHDDELDLHLVADLQGAEHAGVRRDAVRALEDRGPCGDPLAARAGGDDHVHGMLTGHAVDGEVAEHRPAGR